MQTKRLPINLKAPLQQQVAGAPFERVAVDLMGPFETTQHENRYIAVFQDYFTKWVVAEGIPDKKSQTVADVLYSSWITKFGGPRHLHSDQGGEFTSALFTETCTRLRIDKT